MGGIVLYDDLKGAEGSRSNPPEIKGKQWKMAVRTFFQQKTKIQFLSFSVGC